MYFVGSYWAWTEEPAYTRGKFATYKGIQQISKSIEDNESQASHGERSYIQRKGKG